MARKPRRFPPLVPPIRRAELLAALQRQDDRLSRPIAIDGKRYLWIGAGFVCEGKLQGDEVPVVQ